jgi:hypothetical protein
MDLEQRHLNPNGRVTHISSNALFCGAFLLVFFSYRLLKNFGLKILGFSQFRISIEFSWHSTTPRHWHKRETPHVRLVLTV